ncbi:NAD(P)H-dependent oxidoreductase [Pseudoalteromonas sp. BDTF-M6]|uniref:flavodoxin family protein n=1 Tax=Pseudoalteromonas sp. BDTF-M6 TaxID=2796132 RepID=UPI001BAF3DC1|nr:NAD(P)H-dependent oxidoreductase [Pseudoalteromonas sp. BDTF-M6]MBS3797895.1 NAD(P)H-dependent oxidoreductase [Pseudoalteromonas sp. BDTF-M6]
MAKHIIIFSSARRHGNTYKAARTLARRLDTYILFLDDFRIKNYCYEINEYKEIEEDDFRTLIAKLITFEHWVFASPVYWYNTTPQLKNFFDRLTDYMNEEELRPQLRLLRKKHMSLLSTSNVELGLDAFAAPFKLSAEYLGMRFLSHYHASANKPEKIAIRSPGKPLKANSWHRLFVGVMEKK